MELDGAAAVDEFLALIFGAGLRTHCCVAGCILYIFGGFGPHSSVCFSGAAYNALRTFCSARWHLYARAHISWFTARARRAATTTRLPPAPTCFVISYSGDNVTCADGCCYSPHLLAAATFVVRAPVMDQARAAAALAARAGMAYALYGAGW